MFEYHREQIVESEFDTRAAELAGAGWRLVSVVVNPLSTAEAAPLYITFWERALA